MKPSDAVTAMIDGLWERDEDPNFTIDMSTFGEVEGEMCFGCAATCAVLELYPESEVDQFKRREDGLFLGRFEEMIDDFREGSVWSLGRYFGVELPEASLPVLGSRDWKEGISYYEDYRDQLLEMGQ